MFCFVVKCRARKRAFAPYHGGYMRWILGCVGVGDHPANVVSHHVDLFLHSEMVVYELVEVLSEDIFGVSGGRLG